MKALTVQQILRGRKHSPAAFNGPTIRFRHFQQRLHRRRQRPLRSWIVRPAGQHRLAVRVPFRVWESVQSAEDHRYLLPAAPQEGPLHAEAHAVVLLQDIEHEERNHLQVVLLKNGTSLYHRALVKTCRAHRGT